MNTKKRSPKDPFSSSMADTNYYTKHQQQNQANPSKFYYNFLYKALIVAIFLVILPLFPSQAPEFINQTLNTRGWEFLHLVFVGIAVSYGLFSRRNDETEKENNNSNNKFDNAQSYVSRLLQVSSFFDDEADSLAKSDGNKVQTWSSQYYRNEPVVVVAEEHSALDKEPKATSSRISEKPLLLPVRSLKSRVFDTDADGTTKESTVVSGSISRSSSKRFSCNSSKSKNVEFGGFDYQEVEEKLRDNVVLPSPIPWRSRSGRMEMKEEADAPQYNPAPSMEESEYSKSFRAQVSRSPQPNSTTSSPKLSPSPAMSLPKKASSSSSFSSETQGKSAEDFMRKKSFHRSPPPPPPPPPPPVIRKSSSMNLKSTPIDGGVFVGKNLKRSFTNERICLSNNLSMPKSGRAIRSNDSLTGPRKEIECEDGIRNKASTRSREVEASTKERSASKKGGFDQSSFKTERLNCQSVTFIPQPTFKEFPEEEDEEFAEKLPMASDEDLETEEEDVIAENTIVSDPSPSSSNEEAASGNVSDGGPDVDKKADEFIAKFREQIRLQRIESIKRTSAQISSRKDSR